MYGTICSSAQRMLHGIRQTDDASKQRLAECSWGSRHRDNAQHTVSHAHNRKSWSLSNHCTAVYADPAQQPWYARCCACKRAASLLT
jgi:hypothetical protein